MTKKRFTVGICTWICCFLLLGSMESSAFCYAATPNWSKLPLSSKVTFKATTIGGIEARGYYAFAFAALRTDANSKKNLSDGGFQTSFVVATATSVEISSSATYDCSTAKIGYAEYGISSNNNCSGKVPGKHIEMQYSNIY